MISVSFAQPSLPPGGVTLLAGNVFRQRVPAQKGENQAVMVMEKTLPSYQKHGGIFRLSAPKTSTATAAPTDIRQNQEADAIDGNDPATRAVAAFRFIQPVKAGDLLLIRFRAKAPRKTFFRIYIHAIPHSKGRPVFREWSWFPLSADTEWREFSLPMYTKTALKKNRGRLSFQVPMTCRDLQIADLEVINYGRSYSYEDLPRTDVMTYPGQEPDARWRREALARIEKIRKSDVTITVVDKNGKPIPDAKVQVDMTRHAFGFGSAANRWPWLGEDRWGEHFSPADVARYRKAIEELCNEVTIENGLLPGAWVDEQGRAVSLQFVDWLNERGIGVRGMMLLRPAWSYYASTLIDEPVVAPLKAKYKNDSAGLYKAMSDNIIMGELYKDHQDELKKILYDQADEKLNVLRGKIIDWIAINHPTYSSSPLGNAFSDLFGNNEWQADFLKHVHNVDKTMPLYINEGGIDPAGDETWLREEYGLAPRKVRRDQLENLLKLLKAENAPFDGVGMMSHFNWYITPPETLLKMFDRFAPYGKIIMTEYDVDIPDEKLQGDYLRDFLIAFYSHPAARSMILWGFWDKAHWLINSPIYRRDWSLKPSGEVWKQLIYKDWWSNESGTTNRNGKFNARVFHGEYKITVEAQGRRKEIKTRFAPKNTNVKVILE
ncbi:MAG: endo-1,4-beta-xylanase [Phycisphaerae bacterium]|nr:endo-1,4-beta-xylanase [Phycisphaerae bacterium]